MPRSCFEKLALIPACLTLLWFSEQETVPQTVIQSQSHSCIQNLLAPCTTPSSCAYLSGSHFLFLLQICTSFQADLELSKIEHRLGAKSYLKKQRQKNICDFFFQPFVFNHPFFHPTAMLALQCYWYTDIPARKARNGQAAFLSAFLGSTALHSQNVSPFSWGRILWHIRLYNRHKSPFPKPQCQSCLYLMCVWDGFVTIPHCPPIS